MSDFKQVVLGLGIVLSFIGCLQSDVLYANGSVKVYEKRIISFYEIGERYGGRLFTKRC